MHIHYDKSRQFYYVKHYTAAGTVRRTKLEGVTTEEEAQAMVDAMQLKELEFAAKFRQTERGKPLQKTLARILQKMVHSDPAPSGDALIRAFADHLTNVRRFVPSTVQNMCYTVGQFATWLKEMKGIQLTPTSWTLKHASEWINEGLLPGQDPSMVGGKTIRFYQVRRITLVRFEQWLVEQGWKAEAQVKSARVMVREIMPENRYQPKRPLATEEQVADIVARLPDFCRPEEWLPMRAIALLGWHPADEREILSMDELVRSFSLDRVSKSGARFDPEPHGDPREGLGRGRAHQEHRRVGGTGPTAPR